KDTGCVAVQYGTAPWSVVRPPVPYWERPVGNDGGEGPRPDPEPGAALSPARRAALEMELAALRLIVDDKMSSEGARRMAAERAKAIAKLLRLPSQPA